VFTDYMWTMCGVVCILLYYVLYQSSLWLPDFNKLLVWSCLVMVYFRSLVGFIMATAYMLT